MNGKLLDRAVELQALAQAGVFPLYCGAYLCYTDNT